MSIFMSEQYITDTLREHRIGIYELRNIARVFNIKTPSQKSRDEIIAEMSKIDMQFSLNKLEMILYWHNLLTISH
jgi:hypothetical protein